jgi:hypothetical protein
MIGVSKLNIGGAEPDVNPALLDEAKPFLYQLPMMT